MTYPRTLDSTTAGAVCGEVLRELLGAMEKFGPMASPHEAYAVLLEEVDEFWEAVKSKDATYDEARAELIQVAAMAVRAVVDCYCGVDGI